MSRKKNENGASFWPHVEPFDPICEETSKNTPNPMIFINYLLCTMHLDARRIKKYFSLFDLKSNLTGPSEKVPQFTIEMPCFWTAY